MGKTPSRIFPWLAALTVLFTVGLIVLGAVVRVTDSGLGCGDSWPLCDGRIIPPFDNLNAWIEWSHRLSAIVIGICGVGMLYLAWRKYRPQNLLVAQVTTVAAVLYALQAMLGRFVVVLELPPTMVTVHLGTGMLLLGALLASAMVAVYKVETHYAPDQVTNLAYVTTALAFLIMLTGALVRGSGATLACTTWPLCNGQLFPSGQGQLAIVHMLHRFAVAGLGVSLLLLVWFVLANRRQPLVRTLASFALTAYGLQAVAGALFVNSGAKPLWGAAHVGLAATTWALLLALSIIETLNTGAYAEHEWQSSETTTS